MSEKTKVCPQCGEEKTLNNFYKVKRKTKNGIRVKRQSWCKSCYSVVRKLRRKEDPETIEKERAYRAQNKEKIAEYNREYAKNNREKFCGYTKAYRERNLARGIDYAKITNMVNNAVACGRIKPAAEVECDCADDSCSGRHQYHHDSYLKGDELAVRCLCKKHHYQWHMNNKAKKPVVEEK